MDKQIALIFYCLIIGTVSAFSQSAYFFKTTEALKLEKWDAEASSQFAISNAIYSELQTREETSKKVETLEAKLNEKLEAEDYFGADKIKQEIEQLKSKQTKANELRENIQTALTNEDYEQAAQYKQALLTLDKTTSTDSSQASNENLPNNGVTSAGQSVSPNKNIEGAFAVPDNTTSMQGGFALASGSKMDMYGRTEEQNRKIHKKRAIVGGALFGVGFGIFIPGVLMVANRTNDLLTGNALFGSFGLTASPAPGAILAGTGLVTWITGAAILSSARKFKKRANALSNSSASITPTVINAYSFNGPYIINQPSYGLTFSYEF